MRKTFAIAFGVFLSLSLSAYAEENKLGDLGKGAAGGAVSGAGGGSKGGGGGLHIDLTGRGIPAPNNPNINLDGKSPHIKPTTTKPVTTGSEQQKGRQ